MEPLTITQRPNGTWQVFLGHSDDAICVSCDQRTGLLSTSHEESNIQGWGCWIPSCQFGTPTPHTALGKTTRQRPSWIFSVPREYLLIVLVLSCHVPINTHNITRCLFICLSHTTEEWTNGDSLKSCFNTFKKIDINH